MLKPELVLLVEELLANGQYSQRAIALRTGVSRATIAAMASGKRRVLPEEPEAPPPVTSRCRQCVTVATSTG